VGWVRLIADLIRSRIATFFGIPKGAEVGAVAPPPTTAPPARVQTAAPAPTSAPTTAPSTPPGARPPPPPSTPPGARPPPPPPGTTPLPGEVLYYRQLTDKCTEICYKDGNVNWVGDCVPYPLVDMARTGELDYAHEACERAAGVRS
jgi:hypothetical protein